MDDPDVHGSNSESSSGPGHAGRFPHCNACGYDLRGLRNMICPECGAPRRRSISYFNREEFDQARQALEAGQVPHEVLDPRMGIVGVQSTVLGFQICGRINIAWRDIAAAEQAMENAGINLPASLVDAARPYCPCCGFELALSPDDESIQCSVCGTRCVWYWDDSE